MIYDPFDTGDGPSCEVCGTELQAHENGPLCTACEEQDELTLADLIRRTPTIPFSYRF